MVFEFFVLKIDQILLFIASYTGIQIFWNFNAVLYSSWDKSFEIRSFLKV
jgi:hypothetical protein